MRRAQRRHPARVSSSASQRARLKRPRCARRILSTLAGRAYRRPVASNEIADLMSSYDQGRSNGSFSTGVQFGLRRILASPSFVFRPEVEPASVAVGAAYRITDTELASRLSFFLWSTLPDDQLLRAAREGRLSQPAVLRDRDATDARGPAFIRVRQQLRRAVAAPAQPSRHHPELGPVPGFRRQPSSGVSA